MVLSLGQPAEGLDRLRPKGWAAGKHSEPVWRARTMGLRSWVAGHHGWPTYGTNLRKMRTIMTQPYQDRLAANGRVNDSLTAAKPLNLEPPHEDERPGPGRNQPSRSRRGTSELTGYLLARHRVANPPELPSDVVGYPVTTAGRAVDDPHRCVWSTEPSLHREERRPASAAGRATAGCRHQHPVLSHGYRPVRKR